MLVHRRVVLGMCARGAVGPSERGLEACGSDQTVGLGLQRGRAVDSLANGHRGDPNDGVELAARLQAADEVIAECHLERLGVRDRQQVLRGLADLEVLPPPQWVFYNAPGDQ